MKKITFENLPSTNTPINSTNLNQVQDNVEKVFNGEESMGSIVVEDVTCKNIFDINDITQNLAISEDGSTSSSTKTDISGYMPVKAGQQYIFSYNYTTLLAEGNRGYVFYDLNKTYLSGKLYVSTDKAITITPTQDGYVRIGYDKNCYDIQFEQGEQTDYVPYKKFGYNSTDSMGEIVVDDIKCKNLFNKNTVIHGYWINNGVLEANALWNTSDYIKVKPNTTYSFSSALISGTSEIQTTLIYYDADKNRISSSYFQTLTKTEATPSNCYYVRILYRNDVQENIQFEEDSVVTDYVEHKEFGNKGIKKIWDGNLYEINTYKVLNEPLEVNKLYIFVVKGLSSTYTISIPYIHASGSRIQYSYYDGTTVVRWRIDINSLGTEFALNEYSLNMESNTGVIAVYKVD